MDSTVKSQDTESVPAVKKTQQTGNDHRKKSRGHRKGNTPFKANAKNNPSNHQHHGNNGLTSRPKYRKDQSGQSRKPIYSAIDLGTNNCRLLIAKPTDKGFRVIDAYSKIVRLGEGVEATGKLSDAAMDRTIEALKICAEKIARRGVTTMHHVATEACRAASNGTDFIERVRRETGINIDVISAADEARLAVMGCQNLIAQGNRHALVFDIGGGSTELIWVRLIRNNKIDIQGWTSIPWGVVNLTEKFMHQGQTAKLSKAEMATQFEAMVTIVQSHLDDFENNHSIKESLKRHRVQLLGTSGTVTTLASLHLELPSYDRSKVDGVWLKAGDIRTLSNSVASMTYAERAAQPCIGEDRADLVVAGCAILEALLGMWPIHNLRVADRGIREGILRNLIQRDAKKSERHTPKKARSGPYRSRRYRGKRQDNKSGAEAKTNTNKRPS